MSKFIDRLKEALRPTPQPMGFYRRTAETNKKAKVLLVAALDKPYTEGVADMISGADAVLLPVDSIPGAGDGTAKALGDIPCGEWLSGGDPAKLEALSKNGCDFVVFRADKMGLGISQIEKLGKILEIDTGIEDAILRTVNTLPVDAIFVRHEGEEPPFFTFHDVMVFRHFTDFVAKPIIVTVTNPLTDKDILALWEAGVDAMVVASGPGEAGQTIKKLRQELDRATFPAQRRVSKHEAVLPPFGAAPAKEEKEEEEEGDGEEEDE